MMSKRYLQRVQQKRLYEKLGKLGVIPSMLLTFIGLIFDRWFLLASIGQMLFYMSVSLGVVFSRIGWSSNKIIDFFFNQFSILLAIIGFCMLFFYVQYNASLQNIGYILVFISFCLVWLGNRLQSSP